VYVIVCVGVVFVICLSFKGVCMFVSVCVCMCCVGGLCVYM